MEAAPYTRQPLNIPESMEHFVSTHASKAERSKKGRTQGLVTYMVTGSRLATWMKIPGQSHLTDVLVSHLLVGWYIQCSLSYSLLSVMSPTTVDSDLALIEFTIQQRRRTTMWLSQQFIHHIGNECYKEKAHYLRAALASRHAHQKASEMSYALALTQGSQIWTMLMRPRSLQHAVSLGLMHEYSLWHRHDHMTLSTRQCP